MIRKVIKIDENKCDGCGACVKACHEGAIGLVNGKAKLLRDDYCDGLGDCLPSCHTNAISFEEREALPYDEEAVKLNMAQKKKSDCSFGSYPENQIKVIKSHFGCPGSNLKTIKVSSNEKENFEENILQSKLQQWPVQIKLVPINAPYFDGANLLIAADCTAFAYGNFHNEFIKNRITLIGCPKLDSGDYEEKLTEIIKNNNIKSLTVVRMEVPCCGGIERASVNALKNSGKFIPWQVVTISIDGKKFDI